MNINTLHTQSYQYLQSSGIETRDGVTMAEVAKLDSNQNGALELNEVSKVAIQDTFKLQKLYAQKLPASSVVFAAATEQDLAVQSKPQSSEKLHAPAKPEAEPHDAAHHTTVSGVLAKHSVVMVGEEILHHAAAKMAHSSNASFAVAGHKLENNALPVIGAVSAGYLAYQSFSHMASAIEQDNTKAAVAYGLAGAIDTAIAGYNVYTLVTQKPPAISRTVGTALGVAATGLAMTGAYLENKSH